MKRRGLFFLLCFTVILISRSRPTFALSEEGFESLHIFSKVLHHIETYYVESVDEKHLIRGAIRGMLDVLDPHSSYMAPSLYRQLKLETGGRFGGVGIEVILRKGWLTIVAPIEGSPAARAGLRPSDRIIKINGVSTKEMEVTDAVARMRGRPGTRVVLTIQRGESRFPFDVPLVREDVKVTSVRSEVLDGQYGYVRITNFQEQTERDLSSALAELTQKEALKKGMILDLRNNPGGLLDQAVMVADLFIEKGLIVSTQTRDKVVDKREARAPGTQPAYPLVVLVNGGSASAAEIVAGALQDHGRALVLGTQSFGKGSVQTVIELDDGAALKLTIARYYTPSGRSIQAFGITPDVVVGERPPGVATEEGEAPKAPVKPRRFSERELPGHLDPGESAEGETVRSHQRPAPLPAVEEVTAGEDYQKRIALEYLKRGDLFRKAKGRRR